MRNYNIQLLYMTVDFNSINSTVRGILQYQFVEFLESLNEFQTKCILWCVVMNEECSIETFLSLWNDFDKLYERTSLTFKKKDIFSEGI